jgi:hypothetical protein
MRFFWEDGDPRNDAEKAIKDDELATWKQGKGYRPRSLPETAM